MGLLKYENDSHNHGHRLQESCNGGRMRCAAGCGVRLSRAGRGLLASAMLVGGWAIPSTAAADECLQKPRVTPSPGFDGYLNVTAHCSRIPAPPSGMDRLEAYPHQTAVFIGEVAAAPDTDGHVDFEVVTPLHGAVPPQGASLRVDRLGTSRWRPAVWRIGDRFLVMAHETERGLVSVDDAPIIAMVNGRLHDPRSHLGGDVDRLREQIRIGVARGERAAASPYLARLADPAVLWGLGGVMLALLSIVGPRLARRRGLARA